jgi:UDP-galactopyranose mutase
MFDFLIVGSGFFGSICARELTDLGYNCLVIDKRNHIGGNCYTENKDGINIHSYGPHIFHTSNQKIWDWINKYATFNSFTLTPVANYKGEIYSLPFNMWTFSKLYNVVYPYEAKKIIETESSEIQTPTNLEEQAIKLVGKTVYEKLIKGYTKKQWRKDPKDLPSEIVKRLPVRFTYDNNYFNDKYQGIPIGGYTQIFEKLLESIDVRLGVDYFDDKEYWNSISKKIIYTGPIDRYFNYCFGELEYKTTEFKHFRFDIDNFQGTSVMNYTDENIPYTRIIEHKHFDSVENNVTWVTEEYPTEYIPSKTEPYYPVNDKINNDKYSKYKLLADNDSKVVFGGRLGEYKYYDMHLVIESALNKVDEIIQNEKFINTQPV